MISDSVPWRDELLAVADRLEKRKTQKRWTERTSFLVERDVMVSAYAVRRLNEARKISDDLAATKWEVLRHPHKGPIPDAWNRWEIWESFDLESSTPVQLSMTDLCNQIIHSFVWHLSASEDEGLFDGIFVCSDRKRNRNLYFLPIDVLINLFRIVGMEDVYTFEFRRDSTGQMQIVNVKGRPWCNG